MTKCSAECSASAELQDPNFVELFCSETTVYPTSAVAYRILPSETEIWLDNKANRKLICVLKKIGCGSELAMHLLNNAIGMAKLTNTKQLVSFKKQ